MVGDAGMWRGLDSCSVTHTRNASPSRLSFYVVGKHRKKDAKVKIKKRCNASFTRQSSSLCVPLVTMYSSPLGLFMAALRCCEGRRLSVGRDLRLHCSFMLDLSCR